MEITTRDQLKKGMTAYCVRVSAARETKIEAIAVLSDPYKYEYGDGEMFMWVVDTNDHDRTSITDMGIDQIPQYNHHRTFTSLAEAEGYEGSVRIDYASLDEKNIEFGGEIYNLDDTVDPKELIPFDFDMPSAIAAELDEMNLDWVMAQDDATEEILRAADEYCKQADKTTSAYDHAMKIID